MTNEGSSIFFAKTCYFASYFVKAISSQSHIRQVCVGCASMVFSHNAPKYQVLVSSLMVQMFLVWVDILMLRILQHSCKNYRQVDSGAHSSVQAHSSRYYARFSRYESIQPHQPLKRSKTELTPSIFFVFR